MLPGHRLSALPAVSAVRSMPALWTSWHRNSAVPALRAVWSLCAMSAVRTVPAMRTVRALWTVPALWTMRALWTMPAVHSGADLPAILRSMRADADLPDLPAWLLSLGRCCYNARKL